MTEFTFQTEVKAMPEKVWELYANVNNWFTWESDLKQIKLNGDFTTGTTGTMLLEGQPEIAFTLTSVIPNKEFWDKSDIPQAGIALHFGHTLTACGDKTVIKHTVKLERYTGAITDEDITFLSQVFSDTPQAILAIKKIVEKS